MMRMTVKESMSYCEPSRKSISIQQIVKYSTFNAPSSIEDALRVLNIEVELRKSTEYIESTTFFL